MRFACFIALLYCVESFSQGIYEIRYQFYLNDTNGNSTQTLSPEHTALVFFYDANSENNIMRIIYYDGEKNNVIEQKVNGVTTDIEGKEYWILAGFEAVHIDPEDKDQVYYPDHIVLSRSSGAETYEPDFVMDDNKSVGKINSWKVLNRAQVTNAYLAPFEWQWPDEESPQVSGTLRLMLVTNSDDMELGDGFKANHRKLKKLFNDMAKVADMAFEIIEVQGDEFNRSTILQRIREMNSSSNDVIIFFYSGHGFKSGVSPDWPQLDLRSSFSQDRNEQSLNLDLDVYSTLNQKDHRLLIVIGDCCNTTGGTPFTSDPIRMAAGENVIDDNSVKTLLSKSGEVMVASCSPGQGALYYHSSGGYFCNNFISSFVRQLGFTGSQIEVKWREIITHAIKLTSKEAKEDDDPRFQDPIWYYNIHE